MIDGFIKLGCGCAAQFKNDAGSEKCLQKTQNKVQEFPAARAGPVCGQLKQKRVRNL